MININKINKQFHFKLIPPKEYDAAAHGDSPTMKATLHKRIYSNGETSPYGYGNILKQQGFLPINEDFPQNFMMRCGKGMLILSAVPVWKPAAEAQDYRRIQALITITIKTPGGPWMKNAPKEAFP